MSKKYIAQVQNNNFIYPNNELYEYDQEIIHDINNNMVSGSVSNFVVTLTNSNQNMTIDFNYHWVKNGAEPSFLPNGELSLVSVHMMKSNQGYFKPWTCIANVSTTAVTSNDVSNRYVTNIPFGQTLPEGVYTFEFRFIAHRCILPIVITYNVHYTATFNSAVSAISQSDACTNPELPSYTWTVIGGTGTTMCSNEQIRSTWLDTFGNSYTYFWLYNGINVRQWQILLSNQGYFYAVPYTNCTTCSGATPTPTPTITSTPATINCNLIGTAVYQ